MIELVPVEGEAAELAEAARGLSLTARRDEAEAKLAKLAKQANDLELPEELVTLITVFRKNCMPTSSAWGPWSMTASTRLCSRIEERSALTHALFETARERVVDVLLNLHGRVGPTTRFE